MGKSEERLHKFLRAPEYRVIDSDKITSKDNGDAYLPVHELVNILHDMNHKALEDVEGLIIKRMEKFGHLTNEEEYGLNWIKSQLKTLKL